MSAPPRPTCAPKSIRPGSRPPTCSNTPPRPTTAPKVSPAPSRIPVTGVAIGGNGTVLQHTAGLEPDTGYRFRAVATNNDGVIAGAIRRFTTREAEPVFKLPDSRGWEMVSPVNKNGGSIQGFGANFGGGVIQAAAQGGTITYTSASSFQDPQGAPGAGQYVSRRGDSAWSTENVTPPGVSGSYPGDPVQRGSVPDLLLRSELGAGQQRPPLPQVRDETVPGRKPAAGGVGSAGRLPQLLRARQLERDLRGAAEERRPRRAEPRSRGLRTGPGRRDTRPRARRPLELCGADHERDRSRRHRRGMRRLQAEPLREVGLLTAEAGQPAARRHDRHTGRDSGRAEWGDLHRCLPRLLDRRDKTLPPRWDPDQTDRRRGGWRRNLPDRQRRRLRGLLHDG